LSDPYGAATLLISRSTGYPYCDCPPQPAQKPLVWREAAGEIVSSGDPCTRP
jgi:hypothetical protein